ncbi:hypothetical protein CDAR_307201, partial [Caerostris darwini]
EPFRTRAPPALTGIADDSLVIKGQLSDNTDSTTP